MCAALADEFPQCFFGDKQAWRKKKKEIVPVTRKFKLQPLGDRVVVEREESEAVTAGGIVLPDYRQGQAHPRHRHQCRRRPPANKDGKRTALQVKAGDRVLFTSYAGEQFKLGDRELLLMREEDILAVIG